MEAEKRDVPNATEQEQTPVKFLLVMEVVSALIQSITPVLDVLEVVK